MRWSSRDNMAALIGLSPHTLRRYRQRGEWREGIHYSKLASNNVKYNERLILDWVANRHNPIAHEIAIKQYLNELSNNDKAAEETRSKRQRNRP